MVLPAQYPHGCELEHGGGMTVARQCCNVGESSGTTQFCVPLPKQAAARRRRLVLPLVALVGLVAFVAMQACTAYDGKLACMQLWWA